MGEIFAGMGEILAAFAQNDSWMLSQALRTPGAWGLGLFAMLAGGGLVYVLYRYVPFLERRLESWVMVISYLTIGGIIFFGVIQRFVPDLLGIDPRAVPRWLQPWPWTTTIPPFLFLIMTWLAAAIT